MIRPPFMCKYCGALSWVPRDQHAPPPDYCHDSDHGTLESFTEPLIYDLLSVLGGLDTYDVNLRDHKEAWRAVEGFVAALGGEE